MAAPIGNNNAAKAKEWQLALRRAMARIADGDYRKTLDDVALVVVQKALSGDKDAWKEIGDREDGKPAQAIVGDNSSDPVNVLARIERHIVRPADRDS
jgi:hypothetical protein